MHQLSTNGQARLVHLLYFFKQKDPSIKLPITIYPLWSHLIKKTYQVWSHKRVRGWGLHSPYLYLEWGREVVSDRPSTKIYKFTCLKFHHSIYLYRLHKIHLHRNFIPKHSTPPISFHPQGSKIAEENFHTILCSKN